MKRVHVLDTIQSLGKPAIFVLLSAIAIVISIAANFVVGGFLSNNTYDALTRYIGTRVDEPHRDVVLLLIDEHTIRYGEEKFGFGRWPWRRNVYAEIITYINSNQPPKAVFFDIVFSGADENPENDARFAEAIAGCGNIYHNAILDFNPERKTLLPLPPDVQKNFLLNISRPANISHIMNRANEYTMPLPCLRSEVNCAMGEAAMTEAKARARGLSVANFSADGDGVNRRGRIIFSYGDDVLPSMTLSAIMACSGNQPVSFRSDRELRIGGYRIPLDSDGQYLVHYYTRGIPPISMSMVMESIHHAVRGEESQIKIRPEFFKDKIVIIGCSAIGCQDLKVTPISKTTPGSEIFATMASNILQNNHIIPEHPLVTALIALIVIMAGIAAVLFVKSLFVPIPIIIGVWSLYAGISCLAFYLGNYMSAVLNVLLSGGIGVAIAFSYQSLTEGAEKRKYSKILGNLIDPHVVSEALKDLDGLKRGGEKVITAFFSDIASFSTISEKLTSIDLAALLNEYLSAMTMILKNNSGTLDKYIGDAIVGIFGAPIESPSHALFAARASLDMIEKLAELRKKWGVGNEYCPEAQAMHIRIGLNTGKAKVGFMGTENLASYTMMGDTVNLAARLESACKDYGVAILVSESTKKEIESEMFTRELDSVRVKGKMEPVHLYELIARKGAASSSLIDSTAKYEQGLRQYYERRWDNAIDLFRQSIAIRGAADKAAELLVERCLLYRETPPAADWDGVFTRTHK